MTRTRLYLAASAAALGMALVATPASAQVVCDSNAGLIGTATGTPSFACGNGATASGNFGVAVGPATIASGLYSTALGNDAQALGTDSLAVGQNAHATADFATAIGFGSRATDQATTAVGIGAHADGYGSTALGYYAYATGLNSTAVGRGAYANADGAIAVVGFRRRTRQTAWPSVITRRLAHQLGSDRHQHHHDGRQSGECRRPDNWWRSPRRPRTDAVNVNQLNAQTAGLAGDISDLQAADVVLGDNIRQVDRRSSAGTAVAIAMGGAMFLPDKTF